MKQREMEPLLNAICNYRTLKERERLGARVVLDEEEVHELELRMLAGERDVELEHTSTEPQRRLPRHDFDREIGILHRGRFDTGRCSDLSGEGMGIQFDAGGDHRDLRPGSRLEVLVTESRCGMDYVFPAIVIWTDGDRAGIRFDGLPSRVSWTRVCAPSGLGPRY